MAVRHRPAARPLAAIRARCRRTRAQWVPGPDGTDLVERLEDTRGEEAHRQFWEQEWRYALLDEALRHVEHEVGDKAFPAFNLLALRTGRWSRWPPNWASPPPASTCTSTASSMRSRSASPATSPTRSDMEPEWR